MSSVSEKECREIEIDAQGNAWRITWTEIYRDGQRIAGSKRTDGRREQITPDNPPPEQDAEAVAVFDAVFDDTRIDAHYDRIADRDLDEGQRANVEARRASAKSARQQRRAARDV